MRPRPRRPSLVAGARSVTEHWHELVTTSLLGTDRRDPPAPPPGPLADVVDDALEPTPSSRMLTAVAACVVARRAGLLPQPAGRTAGAARRRPRPLVPPAASRRWWSIVAGVAGARGRVAAARRSPRLATARRRPRRAAARHRRDARRRARVVRLGGPVVPWLLDHQPALRAADLAARRTRTRRRAARHSPSHPSSPDCSTPARGPSSARCSPGSATARSTRRTAPCSSTSSPARRADTLQPLAAAPRAPTTRRRSPVSPDSLAELAATRRGDARGAAADDRADLPTSCARTPSTSTPASWRRSPRPTTGRARPTGGCRRGRSSPTCSAACSPTAP